MRIPNAWLCRIHFYNLLLIFDKINIGLLKLYLVLTSVLNLPNTLNLNSGFTLKKTVSHRTMHILTYIVLTSENTQECFSI